MTRYEVKLVIEKLSVYHPIVTRAGKNIRGDLLGHRGYYFIAITMDNVYIQRLEKPVIENPQFMEVLHSEEPALFFHGVSRFVEEKTRLEIAILYDKHKSRHGVSDDEYVPQAKRKRNMRKISQ